MKTIKELLSDLNDKLIKSKHPQMDNSHVVPEDYIKNIVGRCLRLFTNSKVHYEIHSNLSGSWFKWDLTFGTYEEAEERYTSITERGE